MCTSGEDAPTTLQGMEAGETITVLALCLESMDKLGSSLEMVLSATPQVQLARIDFSADEWAGGAGTLSEAITKNHPSILLLCLPSHFAPQVAPILETLRKGRLDLPPILLILDEATPNRLREWLALGAVDFSLAPLRVDDLLARLLRWREAPAGRSPVIARLNERLGLRRFIGESPVFLEAVHTIPKLARCDVSVFITGETGTGKEMFARAIHYLGPRAERSFLAVNCGAIPSDLMENELFGHEAGAFTGANSAVRGLLHEADKGTLFLDEIDALPLPMQVKFLRFLQEREFRPLGSRKACTADIRVIAASNADLENSLRAGRFRSDLFYRLNVLPLKLPSLRERVGDIPLLARHFAAIDAGRAGATAKELSPSAIQKLLNYSWPGNVRELENIIERALVFSEHPRIGADDISLPEEIVRAREPVPFKVLKARAVADFETSCIRALLAANKGNITHAAKAAQKPRRAFWQLMRKHKISSLLSPPLDKMTPR